VVTQALRLVLCQHDAELCVDASVGTLQAHALLQENDQLIGVAESLVELDDILKVIGMNNDVLAALVGHDELLGTYASEAD
jgi:hypothetical protein